MRQFELRSALFALICLWVGVLSGWAEEREDFFESRIRPVLVQSCFRCHGGERTSGELRIDSREALLEGGDSGPAIVPGDPQASLLLQAIQRQPDVSAMPPEKEQALSADQIADFTRWIREGAAWPEGTPAFVSQKHWAFEPVQPVTPPLVKGTEWCRTDIDPFILARLEAAEMPPAPQADKLTLIRRATFDLTGLPPTPGEVAAFLADTSPTAFATVVDRLLQSPRYGEKWGRHWLDVVRYADTAGETADYPVHEAWRYRNYVIDSFNADKPYDVFLREQIAGDILAQEQPTADYAEHVVATGYLAISRRFGFDSENYHHLTIQDTIDNLGQSLMGLSLGCARCHDHKFDPISMQDYYALYGIFDSSRYAFPGSEQKQRFRSLVPMIPPSESQPRWREFEQQVAHLAVNLSRAGKPVPSAVLRSLHDLDGDFELQAPAAGGSNGVLVPPWRYAGKIAVTNAAQSPFQHLFPQGRVGASLSADAGPYWIEQRVTLDSASTVYVNLDWRQGSPTGTPPGGHRLTLQNLERQAVCELLMQSDQLVLRVGDHTTELGTIRSNEWHNVQLKLDNQRHELSGRFGLPGAAQTIEAVPLPVTSSVSWVLLQSQTDSEAANFSIEYDNLSVQSTPLLPVSAELPASEAYPPLPDAAPLREQLAQLSGIDGDFELQTADRPPATPWGPGPNSVVKLSPSAQSPFENMFSKGQLGIVMPNRGEYDGFGLSLPNLKPLADGKLLASFDFCCADSAAGGDGSWRYYLGHGPGHSAAVELFFNGKEFFRRSGEAREAVAPLTVGEWYQVQLTLDLNSKTYAGLLFSLTSEVSFTGDLASGWDGTIDYSFIDSYGHLGGVRPALWADNFVYGAAAHPPLTATAEAIADQQSRKVQISQLREQLAALDARAEEESRQLNQLLVEGPFPLAYGMSEGTPHNARLQHRGEPDQPRDLVPRGFIKVLGEAELPADTTGSGRRELAEWLTRPTHPLTARVFANRVWQYHFGQGLVKTPNDFGGRGQAPTHPELLDFLALRFVQEGWSVKSLHRLIMLSATYQQRALPADHAEALNLYAGFSRRRLSAEEIRDSILVVSGQLDESRPEGHPFPSAVSWGFTQHGPFSAVYSHQHRSVYLMTQRLKRHPFLALFDGADPNASTAVRLGTTVPTQALFFLNDPLIHAQSEQWAARLVASAPDEMNCVTQAWQQTCGRQPTTEEQADAQEFLAVYQAELQMQGQPQQKALAAYLRTLLGSNEFLHVD